MHFGKWSGRHPDDPDQDLYGIPDLNPGSDFSYGGVWAWVLLSFLLKFFPNKSLIVQWAFSSDASGRGRGRGRSRDLWSVDRQMCVCLRDV